MTIYAGTTPDQATHTLEIYRGQQDRVEGEDFGIFFAGGVKAADSILSWVEAQGVVPETPDMYALVCPVGEGQDNQPLAILPIAPVAPVDRVLLAESIKTWLRGGRPSIAADGQTTRVTVTLPDTLVAGLDQRAEALGGSRSELIRSILAKSPASITLELETDASRDELQAILRTHGLDLDLQEGGRLGLWVRGDQAILLVARDLKERGRMALLDVCR